MGAEHDLALHRSVHLGDSECDIGTSATANAWVADVSASRLKSRRRKIDFSTEAYPPGLRSTEGRSSNA